MNDFLLTDLFHVQKYRQCKASVCVCVMYVSIKLGKYFQANQIKYIFND